MSNKYKMRPVYGCYGFFAAIFCLLFCACAGIAAPFSKKAALNADNDGYATERPQVEDREELVVACTVRDTEFDFRQSYLAQEAQIFTGIYEGLFSYHPLTMEPVPAAASQWKISDDRKTWTFTIRDGARYSDGTAVKAEDFRASWLYILKKENSSPHSALFDIIQGAKDYRNERFSNPARVGIEAPNERTLVVRLVSPASFFPSMLCHHSFSPIHPSMLNVKDWSKKPPIGSGAFAVKEISDSSITLVKNDYYWDSESVALKRIVLIGPKDGADASAMWNSGKARWLSDDMDLESLVDRTSLVVNALFATHYYFVRSEKAALKSADVRRALSISLPWEELRKEYFLPAATLIYPVPGYPDVEGVSETDVDEAKRLLKEAGFPEGRGMPEIVVRLMESSESNRIASIMAAAWKEIGVKCRVEIVAGERYFESLRRPGYDVGASTWIGDFADPYTFLQLFLKDSNLNDALLDDADYEALIEKSMQEEGAARWTTLSEAESLLLTRGVVLPLSFSPAINIIDIDEIGGWYPNVLNIHPYKYMSYKTMKPLPGAI